MKKGQTFPGLFFFAKSSKNEIFSLKPPHLYFTVPHESYTVHMCVGVEET